jgi:putative ABC transport system permease protein
MRRMRAWFIRIAGIFGKSRRDRELAAELESHLQLHIDDNLRAGMTPQEARRRAIIKLGGIESTKESYRDRRSIPVIETLLQDMRFGLRMLRRNPGFTLTVVLTLALGIGANVTMFSVVDSLLFRMPAQVRSPEQIVNVELMVKPAANDPFGSEDRPNVAFHNFPGYLNLAQNVRTLDLAAETSARPIDFGRGADAREIYVSYVSHTYFWMLGVQMAIGRPFTPEEDNPVGGIPVVVLGYDFWRDLGADAQILNHAVWIGERQFTVIGVAPKGFNGLDSARLDAWMPISDVPCAPGQDFLHNKDYWWLSTIARPKKGVTSAQAESEIAAVYDAYATPDENVRGDVSMQSSLGSKVGQNVRLIPYFDSRTDKLSQSARVSLWLAAVAFIVLLIACANVANLLLVRMIQRKQEMAIRLQLGASRGRLVGQTLVESLLLSSAGGGAALLISYWIRPIARAVLFAPNSFVGAFLNWRLITLTIFFTAIAGISSALIPAWRASRSSLTSDLKSDRQGRSNSRSAARATLLVTQVALTLVLSIGAGLFIESLRHAHLFDQGFQTDRALLASMNLGTSGLKTAEINTAYNTLAERAAHAPRVERVALAHAFPLMGGIYTSVGDPSSNDSAFAGIDQVSSEYFAALGIKILRGRGFLPSDRVGTLPVSIVNQTLARDLWHDASPIGKCLALVNFNKKECHIVVGVVPDQIKSLAAGHTMSRHTAGPSSNTADAYFPMDQPISKDFDGPANGLLIRTFGPASLAQYDISAALTGLAPGGRYVSVRPFSELMDPQIRPFRLGASMFTFFGALALLLSAVGIYGVLAFLVRQRTSEIGIRMALGALPQDVLKLVIWQGMKFAALGLIIGVAAALSLTRLVRSLLFEVRPTDVPSYITACAVLITVALIACLLPAWRAARVDPATSLRHE